MAKNYTFNEAVSIIAEGKNLEAITDIGRRYPVLATKVAVVAAKAGEEFVDLMGYMPDYLTANKVNTAIKASITETDTDEDAEGTEAEATEAEATAEDASEDAAEVTAQWDESMNAKQLWSVLGKAGKRKLAKSTKKADLIEACKQAFGTSAETEDTEEEASDEAANPYEGKSAMDLFKECKKRGIKAPAKKPAKFYADLLAKDDDKGNDEAEEDWSEDEAPTKEDKKPAKAAAKSGNKKTAAKKADAEEDDDWDI